MSIPIIEYIAENVKTAVNAVTVAGGFNQDLTAVRPKRVHWEDEIAQDLTVLIVQEQPTLDEVTATTRSWKQPFVIQAVVIDSDEATEPIDKRLNNVRSDIEKKLCEDKTCGGYADYLKLTGSEFFTSEGFSGVTVLAEVLYTVKWNDPYTKG